MDNLQREIGRAIYDGKGDKYFYHVKIYSNRSPKISINRPQASNITACYLNKRLVFDHPERLPDTVKQTANAFARLDL